MYGEDDRERERSAVGAAERRRLPRQGLRRPAGEGTSTHDGVRGHDQPLNLRIVPIILGTQDGTRTKKPMNNYQKKIFRKTNKNIFCQKNCSVHFLWRAVTDVAHGGRSRG